MRAGDCSIIAICTDLDKFGDEVTADVEGHEGFQASDAGSADEEGGRAMRVVGGRKGEGGDLVIVELDDGGVNADGGQQLLHDVAHAAGGSREDDDGVLGDEALDSGLGGFVVVDG
ncbi:hypothetical protein G2W53_031346 [Senna tora]|uniref:Uncharacterized protein n=1 Tax=Senna tora TaxID=362788 RepID=A0A834T8Y5_9FABA|nr:hypothetical protein G2W53_031346 [Senna tora]